MFSALRDQPRGPACAQSRPKSFLQSLLVGFRRLLWYFSCKKGVVRFSGIDGLLPLELIELLDGTISVDDATIVLTQLPGSPALEKLASKAFEVSNSRCIT